MRLILEGESRARGAGGNADGARVSDGADSYLIRDGKIAAQTIHYTVERDGPAPRRGTAR